MIIMAGSQRYGSETEEKNHNNNKHSLRFDSFFAVWFLSTNDLVLMAVAVIEINVDGANNACTGSAVLCYLCNSCHWESVSIGWAQSRLISPHIIREFDTQIVPVPEIFKANCRYSTTTASFHRFLFHYSRCVVLYLPLLQNTNFPPLIAAWCCDCNHTHRHTQTRAHTHTGVHAAVLERASRETYTKIENIIK